VAFKIILTDSALGDFERLMNWSRDHYAASTEKFGTSLLNHVDLLKAFPLLGRPVSGYAGVRRLLHSPLYVYYRIDQSREAIEVLRFWHASRRPPEL